MERRIYTDNFEQLLKEKSDEFRMYPSKRVWHSIYNDLHPGRRWPSIAMSMLLIIALLLIGYLNTGDNNGAKNFAGINSSTDESGNNTTGNVKTQNLRSTTGINQKPENSPVTQTGNTTVSPDNAGNSRVMNTSGNDANNNSSAAKLSIDKKDGLVESLDNYIRSNRLLNDVALLNKKNGLKNGSNAVSNGTNSSELPDENITTENKVSLKNIPAILNTKEESKALTVTESPAIKNNIAGNKKMIPLEEKAWIEDYALHNKPGRQKWKDRVAMEIYATPNFGYRSLNSNIKNDALANNLTAGVSSGAPVDKTISQKLGLGLEAGVGFAYSLTKNFLVKAGVQLNYTNYSIKADQTNHPILTTLLMNDQNNGNPYLSSRTSTLSNSSGLQPVTLHNKTYQFSLPVGIALKLAGNNNMGWYVGASLQPTFVMGGTANLISSDYKNYISDPSLLRRWNMNTGVETYVNYKLGGYTLQMGPQFRYQLLSTYNKKYTFTENLYNVGLKVGLVKSF